ncbi:MAG: hypothetical protein KBD76_05575 [Bacteriovorax sp.]|nr:hypothetical protein [Bacteriovorax sp.]
MRTLSLMAFASFLILWGVYSYLQEDIHVQKSNENSNPLHKSVDLFSQEKRRDLDKIGQVINEDNAKIDQNERAQIKVAKITFENHNNLKEKQVLLEQSFMDQASSLRDTKRLQNEIIHLKNKMKKEVVNTEKWDPQFIYYLMIQENYTYQEINGIKSLAENGINTEEITYINELIKESAFQEKIQVFKTQGETGRIVASLKQAPQEKDEFVDDQVLNKTSAESNIIEMNYNQEDN